MKGGDVVFWGVVLGGGALAFSALNRSAEASTRAKLLPPPPLDVFGSVGERPPAETSAPTVVPLVVPMPRPRPVAPATAPVPAWNRRTDDGGPELYVPDDVEALARVITSETGSGPLAERIAIGWIARNRARARKPPVSIARLVCSPCGKSSGNQRPFSTRVPATPQNRELASLILASPQSEDPTQGATSCFEASLQDKLHAAGRKGHRLDARGIRYCWLRGLDYYGSVGRWDLFGPKGGRGSCPVPREWRLDGYAVCCYRDQRAACKTRQPGDRLEA